MRLNGSSVSSINRADQTVILMHRQSRYDIIYKCWTFRLLSREGRKMCLVHQLQNGLQHIFVFVLQYLFGDVPRDLNHLMAAGSAQLFPRNKAKQPVTNFCGMTRDGWIAITETGKVLYVLVLTTAVQFSNDRLLKGIGCTKAE